MGRSEREAAADEGRELGVDGEGALCGLREVGGWEGDVQGSVYGMEESVWWYSGEWGNNSRWISTGCMGSLLVSSLV